MYRRCFLLVSSAAAIRAQQRSKDPEDPNNPYLEQQHPKDERGRALADFARSLKIERGIVYLKRPEGDLTIDVYSPSKRPAHPLPGVLTFALAAFRKNQTSYRWDLDNLPVSPTSNIYPPFLARNRVVAVAKLRVSTQAMFPAQIHDAKCALHWMRTHAKQLGIDSNRIALFGASASGSVSSLVALTADTGQLDDPSCGPGVSAKVKMVCSLSGVYDFEYYKKVDSGNKSLFVDVIPPYLGDSDKLYREASPAHYVHRGAPPFLLTHGLQDLRVPYSQTTHFAALLKEAGVPVQVVPINNYQHGMIPGKLPDPSFTVIDQRIEDFFAAHLDA